MDGLLDWYWLGVELGLGVAGGAGRVGRLSERAIAVTAVVVALAIAALTVTWVAAGVFLGLGLGVLFLRHLSREAVLAATIVLALLAFVPVLGYVEAVAAPIVGWRLQRRAGARYAGLRILARD